MLKHPPEEKHRSGTDPLSTLLDKIAAGFCDAPVLPDEAVSRGGIYADHP
jgi:hypothetical protein